MTGRLFHTIHRAMLNILDDLDSDFDSEKHKVQRMNTELVRENLTEIASGA